MKPVNNNECNDGYFFPHHAVIKETSITTKLRVLFDAFAKTSSDLSLNDCLMVEPSVQEDIFSILIRFRIYNIVLTADVAKIYRQILIAESDRPYHRILWRNDSEKNKTCELQTVTYGTTLAAFLATRCLQELGHKSKNRFPEASDVVLHDLYVDDLLTGSLTQ